MNVQPTLNELLHDTPKTWNPQCPESCEYPRHYTCIPCRTRTHEPYHYDHCPHHDAWIRAQRLQHIHLPHNNITGDYQLSEFHPVNIDNTSNYRSFNSPHTVYHQIGPNIAFMNPPHLRHKSLRLLKKIIPTPDPGPSTCFCVICTRRRQFIANDNAEYVIAPFEANQDETPLSCIRRFIKYHFKNGVYGMDSPLAIYDMMHVIYESHEIRGLTFHQMYVRIFYAARLTFFMFESHSEVLVMHADYHNPACPCVCDIPNSPGDDPDTDFRINDWTDFSSRDLVNNTLERLDITPLVSFDKYCKYIDLLINSSSYPDYHPSPNDYAHYVFTAHSFFRQLADLKYHSGGYAEIKWRHRVIGDPWTGYNETAHFPPPRNVIEDSPRYNHTCFEPEAKLMDENTLQEINQFLTSLRDLTLHPDRIEAQGGFAEFILGAWNTIAGTTAACALSFMDVVTKLTTLIGNAVSAIATYLTSWVSGEAFKLAYDTFKGSLKVYSDHLASLPNE